MPVEFADALIQRKTKRMQYELHNMLMDTGTVFSNSMEQRPFEKSVFICWW